VMDVAQGLRASGVQFIFCEHFLEHLHLHQALGFLENCFISLAKGGVLRLSTPNLDWVWATHYRPGEPDAERSIANTVMANRAFHGWGHQFLWNETFLRFVLSAVGFARVVSCRYGESSIDELRGLERHERYGGTEELPDVIIVEATSGGTQLDTDAMRALRERLERDYFQHLNWIVGRT